MWFRRKQLRGREFVLKERDSRVVSRDLLRLRKWDGLDALDEREQVTPSAASVRRPLVS